MMLAVRDLRSGYDGVTVLQGVDIQVDSGELVTVIGSNGAGKTTLLRTISGLVNAQAGRIEFDGKDLLTLSPDQIVKLGIIHVPEGRMVLAKMTVLENLKLGAYMRPDPVEVAADLERVLQMFPWLKDRLSQVAGTLSGGEQQMLVIGRGLMGSPRLLLLDEPSLGVAPLIVDEIFQSIQDVLKQGVTILLVEQNAARALDVADRGYALELGSVLVSGTGAELLHDDKVRQAYLGI